MNEERARVLQMVNEGKITAEEGVRLLNALRESSNEATQKSKPRWFRIRVTDMVTGRTRVNVTLPLSLVRAAIKIGASFAPQDADWNELFQAIQNDVSGRLIEAEDEDEGEKVEIYIE